VLVLCLGFVFGNFEGMGEGCGRGDGEGVPKVGTRVISEPMERGCLIEG